MNPFEKTLSNTYGKKTLKIIQSLTIGIGGAGGLGSNCAFNLVRSGFKNLVIIDYDKIEYSNLNRQFYFYHQTGRYKVEVLKKNLLKINPDLNLITCTQKITQNNINNIFKDCQIIVEAFDSISSKKIIVKNFMNKNQLLVAASGISGWGENDKIRTRKVNETFYMVGDFTTEAAEDTPPLSPRVNIAAAKQADIILNYVISNQNNYGGVYNNRY
ncbi:MAG: sulfur carrier protein ThiS adenylyltransferase ThiF [Halanaerobiales bacterium]